ncbi:hypothetical protein [Pedobacter sp. SYSU D00535]|uniref:hypothetical protein n=1 Tax=Pedobacter sp. SYSU D00535 TaxID=2810308 RepID=UPI001A97ABD2|nr:hypothetical protein [Pedobacter sp. SYSU D00535]
MDIYTYLSLSPQEQAELVFSESSLSHRQCDNFLVMLHTVGDFYVEVFYNPANNDIIKMHPFQSRILLEPYLDNLDIPQDLTVFKSADEDQLL